MMNDCWAVMALPADADERTIKRQYARLLKVHRPDEDAEGFQRLRDAYEQVLQIVRHRDESFEPDGATIEQHEQVQLVCPVAVSPSRVLVDQTTADNLHEQYLQAQAMDCAEDYERGLLLRCLADPEAEIRLLQEATRQLSWLSPWQKLHMDDEQTTRLTWILLDAHQPQLQAQLRANEETGFIDALQVLRQQPWLASLERSEDLQKWVIILLHNTSGWSPELFEQVCALFSWDVNTDRHPEPAFIWQRLIERCEREDFVRHLRRLLASKPFSAEGRAAHLLLGPYSPVERRRMARAEDDNVRALCQRLVEQMTLRYPGTLEEFPHADLESWRSPHEPFSREAWRWLGLSVASIALLSGLSLYFQENQDLAFLLVQYAIQSSLALVVYFCIWRPVCEVVERLDEWLSVRLLPDSLSGPTVNARVLQHGMPLIVIGGGMWWVCGGFGLVLHCVVTVICIAFAPYRYPRPYAALRRMLKGRKGLQGSLIVIAFYGLLAIGFTIMFMNGGGRERSSAAHGGYQNDCAAELLRQSMPDVCRTAISSQECARSEWAQRVHMCRSAADMVKKAMDSVPRK